MRFNDMHSHVSEPQSCITVVCSFIFSRMRSVPSITSTPPLTLRTQGRITVHFCPISSCGFAVGRNFALHNKEDCSLSRSSGVVLFSIFSPPPPSRGAKVEINQLNRGASKLWMFTFAHHHLKGYFVSRPCSLSQELVTFFPRQNCRPQAGWKTTRSREHGEPAECR